MANDVESRMEYTELIGQTLDAKYRIEKELGSGGMGTVYLATHLGTERPVAIKVISPKYMKRAEFVERFRREARAAGRLRHPNVVDVTDFGFAVIEQGQVAYLVMEYLDGCTLGEILEEEKNLPIGWTLDILEQVCSAVHEAHEQGIIHRDLKPENIWLEPNQRGGYTVKVLDFGIAKLEAHDHFATVDGNSRSPAMQTLAVPAEITLGGEYSDATIHDSVSSTLISTVSAKALSLTPDVLDKKTLIQDAVETDDDSAAQFENPDQESVATRLIAAGDGVDDAEPENTPTNTLLEKAASARLTRVGAVLGTPLYMSPEQCRGNRLDARSDIYSIGVIAYQMLSGRTPFTGDFTRVMESHKFTPPPPLAAKGVRKKLRRVINNALAKDPDDRPHSAEAFASSLRSRSEGIFGLLRRAGMIYTEHIQKFLAVSIFFFLPITFLTFLVVLINFLRASEVIPSSVGSISVGILSTANFFIIAFCVYLITGTITWVVAQSLAVPLRPIKLRAALLEARTKWKTFAGLGILCSILPVVSAVLAFAVGFVGPFIVAWVIFGLTTPTVIIAAAFGGFAAMVGFFFVSVWLMLVAPVVMMENLRGREALRRSRHLVSRSLATASLAYLIMFLMPAIVAALLSFMISVTAKAYIERPRQDPAAVTRPAQESPGTERSAGSAEPNREFRIGFANERSSRREVQKDMRQRLQETFLETLLQILLLPMQILVISFTAIIVALLYLKTRQAGGEPLRDLLSKFEDSDQPRKKWQERVRQRLIQSGRISSST